MKMILMLIILIALLLVGCVSPTKESENESEMVSSEMNGNEISSEDYILRNLFSEENWEQMEILFESVEDELIHFVEYLKINNLLEALQGTNINFPAISDDNEIMMHRNSGRVFLLMRDEPEFFDIMRDISRQGVIESVSLSGYPNIQITFRIDEVYTPFTTAIHSGPNFFRYVGADGETPVRFRVREVRDGWYMDISPPHGF